LRLEFDASAIETENGEGTANARRNNRMGANSLDRSRCDKERFNTWRRKYMPIYWPFSKTQPSNNGQYYADYLPKSQYKSM
jgi:hypothetical protein